MKMLGFMGLSSKFVSFFWFKYPKISSFEDLKFSILKSKIWEISKFGKPIFFAKIHRKHRNFEEKIEKNHQNRPNLIKNVSQLIY